jgi:predicted transcriptional regulator
MSTTTLRLDSPLRQRILELAQATGQSAHSFMVDALTQKTEEAEWTLALQREAAQRDADMQATQQGLDWHDVRAWALARAAKKPGKAPARKSLARIKAATPA